MSMSTNVYGIRDLDGKFNDFMQIKLACDKAGTGYPQEVTDYFKHPSESEAYNRSEMERVDISDAISLINSDCSDGIQVDLSKLSDEVKSVQVVNSY